MQTLNVLELLQQDEGHVGHVSPRALLLQPGKEFTLPLHLSLALPDAPAETLIMIKPAQNAAVVDWLEANSTRPMKAMRLWALMFEHLYPHTGQIMLTRDQIADRIGIRPTEVSEIMGELVRFRAIFTERHRLQGVQGPGKVVYFMNKHVAEAGSRATEEELRLIPKPGFAPRVIEGGQQLDLEDAINDSKGA